MILFVYFVVLNKKKLLNIKKISLFSVVEYMDGVMLVNVMVEYNGNVFWFILIKFQSFCKVDVIYFFFDDQICKMKFGLWIYDGFQVDIMNRFQEVDLFNYVVNGEWVFISVRV